VAFLFKFSVLAIGSRSLLIFTPWTTSMAVEPVHIIIVRLFDRFPELLLPCFLVYPIPAPCHSKFCLTLLDRIARRRSQVVTFVFARAQLLVACR
jgi:hypothetical protein